MCLMTRHHLLLLATALLFLVAPAAGALGETKKNEEFSYDHGAENGPEHWGAINPNWTKCGTGKMQSPIDLPHERVKVIGSLSYLNYSYRAAEASIVNRGHDVMLKFEGAAGSVVIDGTAYYLSQLHWHWPSEHTVDGRRYDLELHMVHESADKKAAVVGVLYKVGRSDGFLGKMEPYLRMIADKKDREEKVGVIDPRGARGRDSVYYRYMGSLTTPPCTEGVIWTIAKRVHTVAKYQLDLLMEIVPNVNENARPLQKLNDRNIGIFIPRPLNHG
ncbi:hypothetical protein GUJ93_ZPchr0008g13281 [Zizania palustris]|uniref:Carbonic anhydrase n=1 Tax=Zizania palustris TaxID=103762 RepID=A0A8J5RIP4_ZIZPA|nr:hypothetical protein GUJ93_ZPchr0008g13281 [Zizania palustris]